MTSISTFFTSKICDVPCRSPGSVKSGKVEKGSSYKPSHLYGFYNILRLCEWEINLQPQVPPILQPIGI